MCRSIKVLRKPERATKEEVAAAALQFVRKVSGTRKPALAHQGAYDEAVREIAEVAGRLLDQMGPPRARAAKAVDAGEVTA